MPSLSRSCCTSLVTSSSLSNREVRRRFHLHILAARKDLMHLTAWLNRDGVIEHGSFRVAREVGVNRHYIFEVAVDRAVL